MKISYDSKYLVKYFCGFETELSSCLAFHFSNNSFVGNLKINCLKESYEEYLWDSRRHPDSETIDSLQISTFQCMDSLFASVALAHLQPTLTICFACCILISVIVPKVFIKNIFILCERCRNK